MENIQLSIVEVNDNENKRSLTLIFGEFSWGFTIKTFLFCLQFSLISLFRLGSVSRLVLVCKIALLVNYWQKLGHQAFCQELVNVFFQFPKSPFCIILKENLKEDSGKARFQELGEVKLHKVAVNKFLGDILPESPREGLFKVTIESQNGDFLGETEIMYVDIVEQVLKNVVTYQENMPMFIRAALTYLNENSGRGSCDTPNSMRAGISGEQKTSLSVQLLLRLLYKAAEVNAKWFIHLIFNLPAGRIAFDSYKETSWLPEDVASSQGHEEIAQYLRDVKKRFSVNEEGRDGRSKDIDWQEIMDAIEPTETEIMDVDEDLCGMSQLKIAQGAGTTTIPESKEDESFHMICNPITEEAKLYMATAPEYTNEQLNYFRVCYLATNIIAEGLRAIFKQEWDGRYKTTLGEWKDEPQNGLDFKKSESPRKQREKKPLLATMVNGNRAEWDCTMLFYAILFSDCIGKGLNPTIRSKVNDLRKFRNEDFAHMPHGNLSDTDFQIAINNVDVSFRALGLSTDQIQAIQNQTSFPTEELNNVLKRVEDLTQEVEVLEAQQNKDISAFCVLPPKPSHEVADRDFEVAKIVKQLKDLKEANKNRLSYFYISGNPGSGKSQLAGLVSKRVFDQVNEIPHSSSFVMTVNAESPKTLLESYVSFARKLKCPEYVISNTFNSPDLSSDEKISHLKTLIGTKIKLYTSWLLVVDNVRSISNIYAHLPESGDEQWARGQLLITTQHIASVPSTSCFVCHVSVSKGVELQDARSLLEKLSGISDCETDKVAQVLDYQPLALAIAAIYVKEAKQTNDNFGWRNYLQRLEKGEGVATARIFVETNPTYPKSMTEVLEIAVEEEMKSSNAVLKHTLTLLSFCAAQPLSLEIAVNYIRNVEVDMQDEDDIRMKIRRCPLLLFDENESGAYIRVHQVTHDAVSNVVGKNTQEREVIVLIAIVKALFQFVEDHKLNDPNDLNSVVKGTRTVPHLRTLARTIRQTYSKETVSEVAENDIFHTSTTLYFNKLAETCDKYCTFAEAKEYYELSFRIQVKALGPEHVDLTSTYNNLGCVHIKLGELSQAKEFFDRALAISLKKLGPDHVDVARTYANLGIVHRNLGDLSQAKEFYDRALAIRLKKLGPDHVDVARTYANLGNVHCNLGDLSQAKGFYDRALAIRLKKLGPNHVDVAAMYNNMGNVHRNLGELSQAKEFYDRALAIRLKKLGPDHVDVATMYNNMGDVHCKLGELSQAKEFYDRGLTISLKKLGPDHVDVATMYNNMGNVHCYLGELSQAKDFYDRALAIRLKKLGPDHVDVAATYANLGTVHYNLGELSQAKEFHDRALAIRLKKLGPDHVDVASTYENLGIVDCNLGELSQAKEFHDRALTIRLKILGPDHVAVASTYQNLGIVHRKLGNVKKGKEYHDRALVILSKTPGSEFVTRWPTRGFGERSNVLAHSGLVTAKRLKRN